MLMQDELEHEAEGGRSTLQFLKDGMMATAYEAKKVALVVDRRRHEQNIYS